MFGCDGVGTTKVKGFNDGELFCEECGSSHSLDDYYERMDYPSEQDVRFKKVMESIRKFVIKI